MKYLQSLLLAAAVSLGAAAPAVSEPASAPAADEPAGRFLERKGEGWFWYRDPKDDPKPKKPDPKKKPAEPAAPAKPAEAKDQPFSAAWLRDNMPKLLEKAVDDPTQENVEAYLYAQRVALDKSQVYAERARAVVASDPFLDENNRVPMSTFAKPFFLRGVDAARESALKHLASVGGIWVFFSSTCEYCRPQIYAAQELAKRYGFIVKYISMDGGTFPEVPQFERDNGHAKLLNLTITPTTVLVVPPNGYFVVSQGLMAESQLGDRLLLAADSRDLLPSEVAAKVRAYDRGVLSAKDTQKGASDDPKEWVKYLKDRLAGRY